MRRHSVLVSAFLVLAALPCVLFAITPASASSAHAGPAFVASGSASGSHHYAPPPIPSGSSSARPKK